MMKDGLIHNSSYDKYNLRSSLDLKMSKMVSASLNMGYSLINQMNQSPILPHRSFIRTMKTVIIRICVPGIPGRRMKLKIRSVWLMSLLIRRSRI